MVLSLGGARLFGYIITNSETLPEERQQRFRAAYCGLCRTLRRRHGLRGSVTISYDMTFLALLLNALYEPEEEQGRERCVAHPAKAHDYFVSPVMEYASDMNLALAYYKCLDNWEDDRNLLYAAESGLLRDAYRRVKKSWPDKCGAIEDWLDEVHAFEKAGRMEIDLPVNATGRLLGELFAWPEGGEWADGLRAVGDGLGRFIYFMDAYEDLPDDVRKGRFNALRPLRDGENYEEMCRSAMSMMLADAAEAFETLPIVQDYDILCNVLYSGVWSKYALLQKRREQKKGAK